MPYRTLDRTNEINEAARLIVDILNRGESRMNLDILRTTLLLYKIPGAARTLAPWAFQPAVDHLLQIQTAYVDSDGCLVLGEVTPRLLTDTDKSVFSSLRHIGRPVDIYELSTVHNLLEKYRLGGRPHLSTLKLQKALDNLLSVQAVSVGRGERDTATRYENVKGARVDTRPYDVLSRDVLAQAWQTHNGVAPEPKAVEVREVPEEVTAKLEEDATARSGQISPVQQAKIDAQTQRARSIVAAQLPEDLTTDALSGVVIEVLKIVRNPLHLTQLAEALGFSNTKAAGQIVKSLGEQGLVERRTVGKKTFWNLPRN